MNRDLIPVPAEVMEELETIRLSGRTNMFDIQVVVDLALNMGFTKAAMWIRDNKGLYTQGILLGFRPTNSPHEGGADQCADR
jgi:hypothetical protein